MGFCKGCGATIEWHKTAAGKSIPLDPEPHPHGNITFDSAMKVVYMRMGSKPRMFKSHFATCPKAAEFRRPRTKLSCDHADCEIDRPHAHCFECGSLDHLAEACPDGG